MLEEYFETVELPGSSEGFRRHDYMMRALPRCSDWRNSRLRRVLGPGFHILGPEWLVISM